MRERFSLDVSVFVLVRKGPSILLLGRAGTGWMDGCFSLPAGAHDGRETLAQAAARELHEETGLVARESELALVHLLHCRSGDSPGEWLGAFFEAAAWSGQPELREPHKHDQLAWFAVDSLPVETIPYTRQGIELSQRGVRFSDFGW